MHGALAQLIERCIRIAEVRSLNLLRSTIFFGFRQAFFVIYFSAKGLTGGFLMGFSKKKA